MQSCTCLQIRNAQTIIRVGRNNGIPRYGWVVATAAALVESRLVNVNFGDRCAGWSFCFIN